MNCLTVREEQGTTWVCCCVEELPASASVISVTVTLCGACLCVNRSLPAAAAAAGCATPTPRDRTAAFFELQERRHELLELDARTEERRQVRDYWWRKTEQITAWRGADGERCRVRDSLANILLVKMIISNIAYFKCETKALPVLCLIEGIVTHFRRLLNLSVKIS